MLFVRTRRHRESDQWWAVTLTPRVHNLEYGRQCWGVGHGRWPEPPREQEAACGVQRLSSAFSRCASTPNACSCPSASLPHHLANAPAPAPAPCTLLSLSIYPPPLPLLASCFLSDLAYQWWTFFIPFFCMICFALLPQICFAPHLPNLPFDVSIWISNHLAAAPTLMRWSLVQNVSLI